MPKLPALFAVTLLLAQPQSPEARQPPAPFEVVETTIADIHAAMKAGRLTCRALVDAYLKRITAFDKNGPALNAIVVVNTEAMKQADDLDRRFREGGLTGPLHCIPMIVKDNFETIGLQSAGGSLSLQGFVSSTDAFQVARIKEAGAIVLAKSNMAEYAFSPYETVGSILPGYTRNPYALDRVTAGSSGGTAAAVAANFGAVGLGTDTGNSIRGPSSHQSLAGIRSTIGLTSRAGVIPLNLRYDIAGPMARTLEDAVAVFQVVVGTDPKDPATSTSRGRPRENYSAALVRDGLRGARIGVLHQAYERESTDPEIVQVFHTALDAMKQNGATIVDPVPIDDFDAIMKAEPQGSCGGFKYDINAYLASHKGGVPVHELADIIKSHRFHPSIESRLEHAQADPANGPDSAECKAEDAFRDRFRAAVLKAMDALNLDALVYPTWSNPPRLIGDLNTPHGDNSQVFSPVTGWPAISVPMGYTRGGQLPAGVTFFGRAWSEATLIKLACGYEQATHHRRPPASTPPLR